MVGGSYSIIHPTDECSACCVKYVMLYINSTKYICYAIPCLFVQSHGFKIFHFAGGGDGAILNHLISMDSPPQETEPTVSYNFLTHIT